MKTRTVLVLVLVTLTSLVFAGGSSEGAASGKPFEIRFMTPNTAGSPMFDPMNAQAAAFGKVVPNAKVVIDALPSADLRTKITVEFASGNPPSASWCILSYSREFMKDNLIMDWKPVYADPKHKVFKEWFEEKTLALSTYKDGRIMSAPMEASQDGFFYNKAIFDKFGVMPPKTWDEMIDLAKKARGQGISLLSQGGRDIRFAWFASALLMRTTSVAKANELAMGSALNKWNDPAYGFPQAMQKFEQMVKAGTYPSGVLGLSVNESDQIFVRGETAAYYEGAWKPGGFLALGGREFLDKVHRAEFPAMPEMKEATPGTNVGGTIVGYIVAANQTKEQIAASIEWVKLMTSPEFWVASIEQSKGGMPYLYAGKLKSFDWSKYASVYKELYDAFLTAPMHVPSMDAWAPPPVDLAIKKTAMPGIVSGEFTADKAIAEVQKAAEEYLKTAKK